LRESITEGERFVWFRQETQAISATNTVSGSTTYSRQETAAAAQGFHAPAVLVQRGGTGGTTWTNWDRVSFLAPTLRVGQSLDQKNAEENYRPIR